MITAPAFLWQAVPSIAAAAVVASSSSPLTLPQCIATALRSAPSVRTAVLSVEQSRRLLYKSYAAFSPQVSLSASDVLAGYDANGNAIKSPRYDQATHMYNLNASWNVFNDWNDARSVSQARLDASSSGQSLTAARRALVVQTVQAYFGELLAQRVQKLDRGALDSRRGYQDVTESLYKSGVRSYSDLLDARVETRRKELALLDQEQAERSARGALNLLLSRPLMEELSLEDVAKLPDVRIDFESDLKTALENRPEAVRSRLAVEKARLSLHGSWANLFPALSVAGGLGYRFDQPSYQIAPGVTVTGTNPTWQVSAALNWSVFDGFSRWQDVRVARLALDSAQEDLEALRREIASDLLSVENRIEHSRRSYDLSRDETRTAEEQLGILLGQYRDGQATALQLKDAQDNLLGLQQSEANALYDVYMARAQLLQSLGTLDPDSFQ